MIDSKVVGLIRSLKSKSRGDIATLLIDCKIVLEPMIADEITSRSNVDGLILQAPPDKYRDLENLSDEDRNFILRLFLDSRLDRGTPVFGLRFDIRGDYEVLKKNRGLATDWLERAKNKLEEGKTSLNNYRHSEAISSFQECIEFSLKSAFLLLLDKYPRDHKFDENEFREVLKEIPESLRSLEFHKLYLYSKFWSSFYTIAKYGLENFGIGAGKLFGSEEAELAQKHADKCYSSSLQLKNYLRNPW